MDRWFGERTRWACSVALGLLTLGGCGGDKAEEPDVELQVINGIANDVERHLTLVVKPSRDTEERRAFPVGDSSSSANWVYLHMPLKDGDTVDFSLVNSAGTVVVQVETCTVKDLLTFGYARAFVSYASAYGTNKHVNCDIGFEFDGI
jgi:hypothetical protein